jgi:glucose/mannose transport system substrate-binding protein
MHKGFGRRLVVGSTLLMLVLTGAVLRAQNQPDGDLEIFAWSDRDERPELSALIGLFERRYPDVNVINAVMPGEAQRTARAELQRRMRAGRPPDSIQVNIGQAKIRTWAEAGQLENLDELYRSRGWRDVFPGDLIDCLGSNQEIWSVPVGVHRSNLLWYVPARLKKWGVTPPGTWDAFFKIAPKLRDRGIVPLSLAANWTANHLWESVALAVLGPEKWDALWQGALSWTSDEVVVVWQVCAGILEYTNPDAAALTWQQAINMVVNGQAAFSIMGDWAAEYMRTSLDLNPGVDFGWSASPGTDGAFMFLADSFGLPAGASNRVAAVAWLALLGSREGSDTFNPLKGAISARLDSDLSRYNAYSKTAVRDFRRDRIVGSMANGGMVKEALLVGFTDVMQTFIEKRNPRKAAVAMKAVAVANGMAP